MGLAKKIRPSAWCVGAVPKGGPLEMMVYTLFMTGDV